MTYPSCNIAAWHKQFASSKIPKQVMDVLKDGPATCSQITKRIGARDKTVSHHLTKLRRDGLIEVVANMRDMRSPIYRVVAKGVRG